MPRLPPSLFWHARRLSLGAALLLPVCRDLASALTELRWIQEHVDGSKKKRRKEGTREKVLSLCRRRGRGEPLQYVLGTQPFGPLDLLCRRGVLIPRPEPEAYSMHLADLLLRESKSKPPASLTILDACTGTGCIALLLYAQLLRKAANTNSLRVVGLDLAPVAVSLARVNAVRNGLMSAEEDNASTVRFVQGDLFADDWLADPTIQSLLQSQPLDVLVSNPPYVSADGFAHDTARSVRLFEPKLAQVPSPMGEDRLSGDQAEDVFYVRLLSLAARLDVRIVLCEVVVSRRLKGLWPWP